MLEKDENARLMEKVTVPQNLEEVSRYMDELGELKRLKTTRDTELTAAIAKLREDAKSENLPVETRIKNLEEAIGRFTDARWVELFVSQNRKSIVLTGGTFGKQLCGPWVEVADEKAAVIELRAKGLDDLIRTTESVRKDLINDNPKLAEGLKNITVKPKEDVFFVRPTKVKTVEGECT